MDRDRSPMGGRGGGGNTSDIISDPKTVSARIFVGSITASLQKEQLEDYFSKYGRVKGTIITKNKFGFVQFMDEDSARSCIADGPTAMVDGHRLVVKPAKIGSTQSGGSGGGMMGGRGGGGGGGYGGDRDRDNNYSRGRSPNNRYSGSSYSSNYYDSGMGDDRSRSQYDRGYSDYYSDYYNRNGGGSGSGGGSGGDSFSSYYRYPVRQEAPEPIDPLDPSRPNDVEIVVPNKMQRDYAESVESQLKRLNLLVDLLFPPPDIQPTRVLQDLSDRQCLYAIFITAENEKHQSMTVNILHGSPQEHRNMPLDDAFRLIQQNFEEYVKKVRQRNARQVVPRDIRILLLDLIECKPLSMGDLDKVIKYLRERQNILVDDQIEQKRETAGGSAAMARSMAVTYPGYNYPSSGVGGSGGAASSVGIVGAPTAAPAAAATVPVAAPAAAASYTAASYGVQSNAQFGNYGVAAVGTAMMGQASAAATNSSAKQSDLQERILSLMKGQSGGVATAAGMQQPSGVPAPTGVPAPSGVPPPNMMQTSWMPAKSTDTTAENSQPSHNSLFAAYNPWNQ